MKSLKVVHVVGGSLAAGAARGALWLHRGLRNTGTESLLLTDSRERVDEAGIRYTTMGTLQAVMSRLRPMIDQLPVRAYSGRRHSLFSPGVTGYSVLRRPEVREADILHLHWVNRGFLNIADLARVRIPIVWTLRDMWPITGGCHYAMECERFTQGCGACPQLGSSRQRDLSHWCAWRKSRAYPPHTTFVAISTWLSDQARRSAIVGNRTVVTIGNNVSCTEFFPVERESARSIIGLRTTKRVILAAAQNIRDFHKGFELFLAALCTLGREKYLVLTVGRGSAEPIERLGYETRNLGFLSDSIALRSAYCAADVFVAPSRMEAFGKTIAEAMACGRPVVCFDATGPQDIVDHQANGYRAVPFDAGDMANGIAWVTSDEARMHALGAQARQKIQSTFDATVIARKYRSLYEQLLSERPSS